MRTPTDTRRRDGGFTLIELIVVVVILSFLTFATSNCVLSSVESVRSGSDSIAENIRLVPDAGW